ncbi:isocitrate lyase/phosphoenolpyruvate mutase family protein [Viridibacillus sp. NPDC096237]|uniref:isocitrate lyase/phosphoenolpyruvate mutase family protein n=1 Tax=Viridibacillus sp. NPDC096237 TaxID=3390721 RepID=UPI003CFE0D11
MEAGYSEDMDTIVEYVLRTAEAGVAGINIEDSLKNKKDKRLIEHKRTWKVGLVEYLSPV